MAYADTYHLIPAIPTLAPESVNCMLRDLRLYQMDEHSYDACKMTALLRQSQSEGFDLLERMDTNWKSGANRFERPGEALVCAEHEGRIVAICGRALDPLDPMTLQLRHGYVLPEWRQLGIASAVLKRLLDLPPGMFKRVTIRAYFPPIRKFCEHHGFHPVEDRRYTHERMLG